MKKTIDLHTHTTASDGSYTPSELIFLVKKAGLSAVAITDHDTINGVEEAQRVGSNLGIEVVPGVEISVGLKDNIHILGLLIDHKNNHLNKTLDNLKLEREERNKQMIKNLQSLGFSVSYEEIRQKTGAKNMGRLHVAKTMEDKGFVSDYREAFQNYLSFGGKAYVPRKKLTEKEGIHTILHAGGIPILAHINYLKQSKYELDETLTRLKNLGLKGIEAYYSGYDEQTELLANHLAEKLDLLKSGGTDFHGTHRKGVQLGTGKGNMCVPYELLQKMKDTKELLHSK